MERIHSLENRRKVDFLDERTVINLSITSDALRHLPTIGKEDEITHRERYAALVGTVRHRGANDFHVEVVAIYQETDAEQQDALHGSYTEGIEHVSFDLGRMKIKFGAIRKMHPEFEHLTLVGNIHTHPAGSAKPSEADLASVISIYESADLNRNAPFIFGIAELTHDKAVRYYFYRIFATEHDGVFGYKLVDTVTTTK